MAPHIRDNIDGPDSERVLARNKVVTLTDIEGWHIYRRALLIRSRLIVIEPILAPDLVRHLI